MTTPARGAPLRVCGAFDNMITERIVDPGFPGRALSLTQQAIIEVIVQNDPDSANNVYVGNLLQGQFFALTPGSNITIPINDLNNVHVRTDGGAATVNYIAMT